MCADLEDRFSDGQPRMTALKKFYSFFLSFVLELYIYRERDDNSRDKESRNVFDISLWI